MEIALELLTHLGGAANAKDAYLRLVDRCRALANADAGAVLKPHSTRPGHELLVPVGRPLRRDFVFVASIDRPDLVKDVIVSDPKSMLFEGSAAGANIELKRSNSGEGPIAIVRLEWSDVQAMAAEPVQKLQEALPFVAPLIESLRKYDSKISVHPVNAGDERERNLDAEFDTPDIKSLWRRVHGVIASRAKIDGALYFIRQGDDWLPSPGGAFGRADTQRRIVGPAGEVAFRPERREATIPVLFKGEPIAQAMLMGRSLSAEEVKAATEVLTQAAIFVQKAILYMASKAANPASPLLLVGIPREVMELAESYSDADAPVLIRGQTGTGKESIARYVHQIGRRKRGPFVPFNCAELTEHLAESQLFGHAKGAFTGAIHDTAGLFEQANGGTLFLDEIHVLTPAVQAKFLRAIESGEVRPVGGAHAKRVDVRIIVATNQDLAQRVADGQFLQDLHMRLDVLGVMLPSLKIIRGMIPRIAAALLSESAERNRKHVVSFTPRAQHALMSYEFPGNIRELKNIIEKAVVTSKVPYIDVDALPKKVGTAKEGDGAGAAAGGGAAPMFEPDFENYKSVTERAYLMRLLARAEGKIAEAARLSGLHRTHIYNLMKKHGVDPEQFKGQ